MPTMPFATPSTGQLGAIVGPDFITPNLRAYSFPAFAPASSFFVGTGTCFIPSLGGTAYNQSQITIPVSALSGNTYYYVYFYGKSFLFSSTQPSVLTTDFPLSQSALTDSNGNGRYIGAIRTGDDGSLIPFMRTGNKILFTSNDNASGVTNNLTNFATGLNSTVNAFVDVVNTKIVPATARTILMSVVVSGNSGTTQTTIKFFSGHGGSDNIPVQSINIPPNLASFDSTYEIEMPIENACFYYKITQGTGATASMSLSCYGYTDVL